jgi:hypothetical protein
MCYPNTMKIIVLAIGLALVIELITIYLRLVQHRKSDRIQKKMHMPRIHHSYPGLAIILIDYTHIQNEHLFIFGFALIFSDLIHHLIFEPYIKKRGYDIGMKHHRTAHHYVSKIPAAVALIVVGLFALVTPFTPGSWLTIVGAGMLLNKKPTKIFGKTKKKLTKRHR